MAVRQTILSWFRRVVLPEPNVCTIRVKCLFCIRASGGVPVLGIFLFTFIIHCVKSIRIRICSKTHFPAFGLNMERYGYFLRSDSFSHICNCIIFPTLFSSTFAIKFDEPITGRKSIQTYRSYTYIVSWFMTPSMMGTEQILFLWCTYLHKAKTRRLDICQVNSVVRIASEEWK